MNGQVGYALSEQSQRLYGSIFSVNNHTGDLKVKGEVDFEVNPSYKLLVTAHDYGLDQLSSDVLVIIRVRY